MSEPQAVGPQIVYRMCRMETLQRDVETLLGDRCVYLARPDTLNDVYELSPRLGTPTSEALDEGIDRVVALGHARRSSGGDTGEIERILRSNLGFVLTDSRARAAHRRALIELGLGKCGIGSFTANIESPTLWAHYGSCGRGFAVGYRIQAAHGAEGVPVRPVVYSVDRPIIDPFGPPEDFLPLVMTKYLDWSYEREWRVVRPGPDGGAGTCQVPESSIAEVVLGYDMADADESRVTAMWTGIAERPVLRKGYLCEETYRIRFRDAF
jgi:hypothetical protein